MRTTWNFHSAGQLVFGRGAIAQLGALASRRKLKSILIVSDRRLGEAGLIDKVAEPLRGAGIQVHLFDQGAPEPPLEIADKAIASARDCRPDAILGLGGGSNMDLAKVTATAYTHGGKPQDFFGFDNVPGPVVPLICVPTTSGTGSEVSHAAVLTDTAQQIKVSTLSNYLRPALAVVDPALTDDCPRQVTADSGIDALTHAIEGYTATDYHDMDVPAGQSFAYEGSFPLADAIAEQAIALIGRHLVRAVQQGDDREARDGMALGSTTAGVAFSNAGVALVHALEYPLGGALHCSHGAGNGLLLPFVMRFNMPRRLRKFARIAELLGEDVRGLTEEAAAEKAISAVERLRKEIGIPQRIRDIGGRQDQLPLFANKAFAIQRLRTVNPRPSTEQDLLEILQAAW